jgi:hypothetical protein
MIHVVKIGRREEGKSQKLKDKKEKREWLNFMHLWLLYYKY